jgi:signal transduction histidine kinase
MQRDGQGGIWLYYLNGALLRIAGEKVQSFAAGDGPNIGVIEVIYPDSAGGVLFGGEFGLARFDGHRFHTLRSSVIPSLTLASGIVETPQGETWINTQMGIVRTATKDLALALEEAGPALNYELLNFRDGLPGVAEQDSFSNTAVRGPDHRLWFITSHGIAWVDPTHVYKNTLPPAVLIRSLTANGREYPAPTRLSLPEGVANLQIDYTALSLSTPERVHFRYRLEGVDANWIDANGRRQAFYTKLAPGQYTFNVVAANGSGVWNNEGATLAFVIPPTFTQTKWFLLLCIAAGMGVAWLLYSMRLQQVAARIRVGLEERLAERERIARELHDTLLQGFQGLMLHFQSVADSMPPGQPAHELMERALERADDVLVEGRDRVSDLRAIDCHGDLALAFAAAVKKLTPDPLVKFLVAVEGASRSLHPLVRAEVFKIGSEAIFNAFRHARAESIEVGFVYQRKQFIMRVRDDGIGIDPDILERGGRQGHFGLTGMRERAEKIRAELTLASRTGAGTEIELVVPAKVAYAITRDRRSLLALHRFFALLD